MERLAWNQAATAVPPAPGVAEALVEGLLAPSPGRGGGGEATAERLLALRRRAGEVFGFPWPERVVFTPGATWGLNLVLHGALRPGDRVLSTALEHNAVLRPLEALRRRGVEVEELPFDASGRLDLAALDRALERPAQWMTLTLASNVLGTLQPVGEAVRRARAAGVSVLLDLSQGGGQVPVELRALDVQAAAVAGHKGLRGPRGVGLLFVAPGCEPEPVIQGGTGLAGERRDMGEVWPQRLEPGTPNLPGLFGLAAALEHLRREPPDLGPLRRRLAGLEAFLREQPGVRVLPEAPPPWDQRLGILAFHVEGLPSQVLAAFLGSRGLHCRAGAHCAAGLAGALGLPGGLLRLSPPLDASDEDFERARALLAEGLEALR